MKRLLLLILLSVLALSACAPSAAWQHEWPKPVGTFTPIPAPSVPLQATPTPHYKCVSWREVKKNHVGQDMCVEGVVTQVDNSGEASIIYFVWRFGDQPDTFSGLSFEHDLSDLRGKCVRLMGVIETYEGRPVIIIQNRDQILSCLGK
jgi:hypothetical protein